MINKSLVWIKKNKISLVEKKLIDKKFVDGIIVKVKSASICGSDLKIIKHGNHRVKKNTTMGHEIAGKVVYVSNKIKNYRIGDNISIGGDISCGSCHFCKNNKINNCEKNLAIGHQFDGGFAEYIYLNNFILKNGPIAKFNKKKINYNIAALAEPLACCLNGYSQLNNLNKKTVCIVGCGPIGVMLSKIAKYKNAKNVIVCDINKNALNRLNAIDKSFLTINLRDKSWFEKYLKITDNKKSEIIFTACNDLTAINLSLKMVSKTGYINFFGGIPGKKNIKLDPNFLHYGEISISGSHGSTPKQHKLAINLLENKKINLNKLITHKFNLQNSLKAFKKANSSQSLKVVINP